MEACPICGLEIATSNLPDHASAHFADDTSAKGSSCPVCSLTLPVEELDGHLLAHSLEDTQAGPSAKTATLAEELKAQAAAIEEEEFAKLQAKYGMAVRKREGKCFQCKEEGHWARDCLKNKVVQMQRERVLEPKEDIIIKAQQPATCFQMQPSVISLLRSCLASQRVDVGYSALLCSGLVDHYQSENGDSGWGCGWRNTQMQLCYILKHRSDLQDTVVGGAGFVPDIASLQAWLECAWNAGFDQLGAEQLGRSVQASRKWIGTTECATLLRYWGVWAHIVDFKAGEVASVTAAGRITKRADGTEIHHGVQCDGCNQLPLLGPRFRSQVVADYDLCDKCLRGAQGSALAPFQRVMKDGAPQGMSSKATAKIHQQLADWVWQYFAAGADGSDNAKSTPTAILREPVRITGKPPLYFQHEGHSRTIVGIERRPAVRADSGSEFSLLVLDPSTRSKELFNALRSQVKWQYLVKRGVHTLRQSEYQLLYIEEGVASAAEREASKLVQRKQLFTY